MAKKIMSKDFIVPFCSVIKNIRDGLDAIALNIDFEEKKQFLHTLKELNPLLTGILGDQENERIKVFTKNIYNNLSSNYSEYDHLNETDKIYFKDLSRSSFLTELNILNETLPNSIEKIKDLEQKISKSRKRDFPREFDGIFEFSSQTELDFGRIYLTTNDLNRKYMQIIKGFFNKLSTFFGSLEKYAGKKFENFFHTLKEITDFINSYIST